MDNIRTAIVCIAANENLYIRDFVKWHLKLGFTKIFIGDNSPVDGEHPDFILNDFIDTGQVEIIRLYRHNKNPPKAGFCYAMNIASPKLKKRYRSSTATR